MGPHFAHTTYSQLGEADDSRVAVFSSWANTLNDAHSHGCERHHGCLALRLENPFGDKTGKGKAYEGNAWRAGVAGDMRERFEDDSDVPDEPEDEVHFWLEKVAACRSRVDVFRSSALLYTRRAQ